MTIEYNTTVAKFCNKLSLDVLDKIENLNLRQDYYINFCISVCATILFNGVVQWSEFMRDETIQGYNKTIERTLGCVSENIHLIKLEKFGLSEHKALKVTIKAKGKKNK